MRFEEKARNGNKSVASSRPGSGEGQVKKVSLHNYPFRFAFSASFGSVRAETSRCSLASSNYYPGIILQCSPAAEATGAQCIFSAPETFHTCQFLKWLPLTKPVSALLASPRPLCKSPTFCTTLQVPVSSTIDSILSNLVNPCTLSGPLCGSQSRGFFTFGPFGSFPRLATDPRRRAPKLHPRPVEKSTGRLSPEKRRNRPP